MRADASIHAGIFLLCAAVLMLEVALTRIFSVMLWNHYTFLVISTALLGFGAAGSTIAVRGFQGDEDDNRRFLLRNALLFGVGTVLSVMAVTRLDIEPTAILVDPLNAVKLLGMYLLSATPFFFAGLAICRILAVYASQVNSLYFADLIGAGAGAFTVPFLLESFGAPTAIVVACMAAAASAVAFGRGSQRVMPLLGTAAFAGLAVWVLAEDPWTVHPPSTKPLRPIEDRVEYTRWSLHARIDVLETRRIPLNFGSGVSPPNFKPVRYRTIYMDGSNPSRLIAHDQEPWFLDRVVTAGPYSLAPEGAKVLIIGSGGGIDTLVARHFDAGDVTAVEINPATVELVQGHFADYIGRPFDDPRVKLLAAEGRHFLTLDDARYDVIRLTGVDTSAAGASAGNALDTAYIYTTEAVLELWEHLEEDGILGISRANGWQTLRLLNILLTSLEEQGLEDLHRHVFVVTNERWSDTIIRKRPFTREEVDTLVAWADAASLPVLYDPFTPRHERTTRLLEASPEERAAFVREYPADISVTTDDSPFFFEPLSLARLIASFEYLDVRRTPNSGYLLLIMTLLQATALAAICILAPLFLRRGGQGGLRSQWWLLPYFSMLGLGFILVELVFIQKYMIVVGGPARAMSVTLFSILLFGGIGAYFSERIGIRSRAAVVGAIGAVVVAILASLAFLKFGLPFALGLGSAARIALGVAVLAPVSFCLGIPFPLGVRLLEGDAERLVPWAWACNACLTVIGSVLCLILSMSLGYSAAMWLAVGCYLVAALSVSFAPAARSAG